MSAVFVLSVRESNACARVLGVYSYAYLAQEAADAHADSEIEWDYADGVYESRSLVSDRNYRILPVELDAR